MNLPLADLSRISARRTHRSLSRDNGALPLSGTVGRASPRAGHRLRGVLSHLARGAAMHAPGWLLEALVFNAAFAAAFVVRYGGHVPSRYLGPHVLVGVMLVTAAYTASTLLFGSYRIVWQFAIVSDVILLALAVAAAVLVIAAVELVPLQRDRPIPLSALVIGGVVGYLALGHVNLIPRLRTGVALRGWGEPLIVFGAGSAGVALVRQLRAERGSFRPVAFLDDDRSKLDHDIAGLPVLGDRDDLTAVLQRTGSRALAVAVPSAPREDLSALVRLGTSAGARVLALPSVREMLADPGGRIPLREVALADLIGRSEITVDVAALHQTFAGKRVLVTGAAGSIGSEVVRQLRALAPEAITMLDNNESGLADLRSALGPAGAPLQLRVANITDSCGVERVFQEAQPQVVIHAAALKHVDLMELQPHEAVRVNVLGTWTCARAAERAGAQSFILISTDKAVDPVGVLGSSKRLGELMMASLDDSRTVFAAVRFGNVIGSRGSVLPRFEEQIKQGGPLTVTHPDVQRFFMSVDEAVRLVLQAAAIASPGRVYILDMGDDLRIASVAERLVQLHGLRVPDDIGIVFTGLRPGERMRECLVGESEKATQTAHPKISVISGPASVDSGWLHRELDELLVITGSEGAAAVRARLLELARQGAGCGEVAHHS